MNVVVLRDHVTANRVRQFAAERGWTCVGEVVRAHYVMAGIRWTTQDESEISYLEDHTADVRSLHIRGRSQHALWADVMLNLTCYREDELLLDAETNPDPCGRIRALCRLAACRPTEANHRYLAVWGLALSDPQKAVRRAAIRTAYGCNWPEFPVLIRQRIRQEHALRAQMLQLLEFFEHGGAGNGTELN